jgi:hypothetical protein
MKRMYSNVDIMPSLIKLIYSDGLVGKGVSIP